MTALPAVAAGPPVTFTLEAVNPATNAPITQVESGSEFSYTASSGCPDPSGCGPAILTVRFPSEVEFLKGGFTPPPGATFTVAPPGPTETGETLTIQWENLTGTAVAYLPVKIGVTSDASLNNTVQTAIATMVAGTDENLTTVDGRKDLTLRVYETPGIQGVTHTWADSSVADGSRAETTSTTTATATANGPSSLTFRSPNPSPLPSGALPASEVFDLDTLKLGSNPSGARIVFTRADSTMVEQNIPAGTLVTTAPANAIGYEIVVSGLPSLITGSAEARTVSVTAAYTLRDIQRTSGDRIIEPSSTSRQVRGSSVVLNTVTDSAPGAEASTQSLVSRDISVQALVPSIRHGITWKTASDDATSVYGSGEASTATIRVANKGDSVLSEMAITVASPGSSYFNLQELTGVPTVTFPAGATSATIRYSYYPDPAEGALQPFLPGGIVPGPDADSRDFSEISGIEVIFRAADGGPIAAQCDLSDDACAGRIVLDGKLRDVELLNDEPIEPPASNPGERPIDLHATITAVAATGATITERTTVARITIIKPQFNAKLSKEFGDSSDQTVYPLTGVAKAGDLYDPAKEVQNFVDHRFQLTASASSTEGATEQQGSTGFVIVDPQVAPKIENLRANPFDAIKLTALPEAAARCLTEDAQPVDSTTTQSVWVLDSLTTPQSIHKVPYDSTVALDHVIGLEIIITPQAASGRFPIDVSCETAPGATVKFRDALVHNGNKVSPESIGSPDTPGLFALGNTAELRTGLNTATTTGSDSLYLVDLERASVYKHYAGDAPAYGIQGQGSPTAFLLSGVPATEDSVSTRIVEGALHGSSLDVFALTGVREARLGPDQKMTLTFLDSSGAPIGPVGTVDPGTKLNGVQLSDAEIADSQSVRYLEFQRIKRPIEWDNDWADGDLAKVFEARLDVTRTDPAVALQRFGAFSVVADMTLRTHLLSDSSAPILGSLGGTLYINVAQIRSERADGWLTPILSGRAQYSVFAADRLFGDSSAAWTGSDGTGYLVAQHQTPSRIILNASNKTALGVAGTDPENQWSATGSIAVGVPTMSVGVGGPTAGDTNPFAITDFAGITSVLWPDRDGAPAQGPVAERKVAAKITYLFADGTQHEVPAPVGAAVSALNPPETLWGSVVGVSITWEERGKYIGIKRQESQQQARLIFDTTLRDAVRADFNYVFVEGTPISLTSEQSIDGALQLPGEPSSQFATLHADYRIALDALERTQTPESGRIAIDVAQSSVAVSITTSGSSNLNRDLRPTARWSLTTKNTGNIPVGNLRSASASELLDTDATWPRTDPENYTLEPGSVFDAFDITRAWVSLPVGAVSATVWARGEDGEWSPGITTVNSTDLALPQTGTGPKTWSDVTGLRVQYDGDELTHKRIQKQATAALLVETRLRERLRTDLTQLSPATELPGGQSQWSVEMSGAGASYLGTFIAPLAEMTANRAQVIIGAGAPRPVMKKFVGTYNSNNNTGDTNIQSNPGSWNNFYVVLENQTGATSNLYGLRAVDTLPKDLTYNAVNPSATWSVTSAPNGVSTTPSMEISSGTPTTMTWTWPEDAVLKPGERIVIRVPLQLRDGTAAKSTSENISRIVATGINGAPTTSICAEESSANALCIGKAYVSSERKDSVRVESYIDTRIGGAATAGGAICEPTTHADWSDGEWVRNPCISETTVGATVKYRLKLINSGNIAISELRFVDELPKVGDFGVVLDADRNSRWTPTLVPGSVRLVSGAAATDLGARGDALLGSDGFRYSSSAKACYLFPDGFSGPSTLECADGTWSDTARESSASLGADIAFDDSARLEGGEYVLVDFEMTVPTIGNTAKIAWNSAALTGRENGTSSWLPASESPTSGARALDTELTITLDLRDDAITPWHLTAPSFELSYTCLAPGATVALTGSVTIPGIGDISETRTAIIPNLPRGAECRVSDEVYVPEGATGVGQYGSVAGGSTGYTFTTEPEDAIILDTDSALNRIAVTNTFAEATVDLGVLMDGDAASYLPENAKFEVAMSCTFAGITRDYGPYLLADGETHTVTELPVGVDCTATETDHRGAGSVTATLDAQNVPLDAQRSFTAQALNPGDHEIRFRNNFAAGGDFTVLKRVEIPGDATAIGDVSFALSCTLGGYDIPLGDRARLTMSFAPGQTTASESLTGLPVGAECTVRETEAGGAHVTAPERTATVLADAEVTVEMLNRYSPAALLLGKTVAGPGAAENRVPERFEIRALCTRELTIEGRVVTVTDHDGLTSVARGSAETISGLPEGSLCAITEPDTHGAESTAIESRSAGAPDRDPAADSALVSLLGPDADDRVQPTDIMVTNTYAVTVVPEQPDLSVTGSEPRRPAIMALLALLAGLGLVLMRRRNASDN